MSDFSGLSTHLMESISAFNKMIQIPVTYFDKFGNILLEWGGDQKICTHSNQYGIPKTLCSMNLASSLKYAMQLGEPYVFVCRAGLVKIAVATFSNNLLTGGFIAGPVVMGSLRESIISKIIKEDGVDETGLPKLVKSINNMRVFTPKEVSYISVMLNNCVLSAVDNIEEYHIRNKRYQTQAKLGTEVRKYKQINREMPYPHELEEQLSLYVNNGNSEKSSETVLKLLEQLNILEAGDLDAVSVRINSLLNILIRGLPDWEDAHLYRMTESGSLDILAKESDFENMKMSASAIFSDLSVKYSESFYRGTSQIIKDTVEYINKHYKEKLTLKNIAELFHVNQSYLSLLFKKEMGRSYTEYLTFLRLREAKKLLGNTDLNLTQIAYRCGFDDQSYFSKVFRKVEGITPRKYRVTDHKL